VSTPSATPTPGLSTMDSAPTGHGAMHFRHPVQVESSIRSPSRRIPMAAGGQSGRQSPHASQSRASTTAISGR
jgi:hypothetical protein